MGDILISCVAADRSRLYALAKAFIDEGHRVGWQHEALWSLSRQVCVVATWSRHAQGARWLENLARGSARRGKLISIRLDESMPPRGLKRHRVVDLSMWPARSADRGVDRLLVIAAEVSAHVSGTSASGHSRAAVVAVATAVVAALALAIWWSSRVPNLHTAMPASSSTSTPAPIVRAQERAQERTQVRPGDPGLNAAVPGVEATDQLPPEPAASLNSTPTDDAQFLGDLALEQLAAAMAGDASMMQSARSNAERALSDDPTQPAARLAIGVLDIAMNLDWQQGHQMIAAAAEADDRLGALAGRLLRMYGEGDIALVAAGDVQCDEEDAARARTFIDLAPLDRLQVVASECFLMQAHGDPALRVALGIDHE